MVGQSLLGIAGTESGSGKTIVTLGYLRALRNRGLSVQPFKVGPDFIDPLYHEAIADRPSVNLDQFFMNDDVLNEVVKEYLTGAHLGLVEGVMGLYDGKSGELGRYSTAELYRMLDVPYVLVVNASGQSHSIAAKIKGFLEYDDRLDCLGVVLTRVASERHDRMLRRAIRKKIDVPVLGSLRELDPLKVPDRHLGLDTAFLFDNTDAVKESLDDELLPNLTIPDSLMVRSGSSDGALSSVYEASNDSDTVIGVARDDAFHFYYDVNLRRLRETGARLETVSPLTDDKIPKEIDGLYVGGGYPEQFAGDLADNRSFIRSLRKRLEGGLPVLAECGGLMYLAAELVDRTGSVHELVGWFDVSVRQRDSLRALGYVEGRVTQNHPFLSEGVPVRGHEFHYSEITRNDAAEEAVRLSEGQGVNGEGASGLVKKNTLASYGHWHFAACPGLAEGFVERAAERSLQHA